MNILLVEPLRYLLTAGGAHKANRILMAGLAARGHTCRVVGSIGSDSGSGATAAFVAELGRRGLPVTEVSDDGVAFRDGQVAVHVVRHVVQLGQAIVRQLRAQPPTHVVISDDSSLMLVETALAESTARVIYLCHSHTMLPFGPASFVHLRVSPAILQRADGVLAVSHYVRRYLEAHAGVTAAVRYFPSYGAGPFPQLGRHDGELVTLINPSAIKGLPILLELARRAPDVQFGAVPTWATTAADLRAIAAHPNIVIVPATANVDEIYARTRVLLVPSLWGEAFGQVVVEAMLRGIPVLGADSGGIPEAKLGIEPVLPVRPIEHYADETDEQSIPIAQVPAQDCEPWYRALRALIDDPAAYAANAERSRAAASAFVAGLGIAAFEDYLAALPEPSRARPAADTVSRAAARSALAGGLTAERRALLALRLHRAGAATSAKDGAR